MDLKKVIEQLPQWLAEGVNSNFMTPSALVLLATSAVRENKKSIGFYNSDVGNYASAIGLLELLNDAIENAENKPKLGKTYSRITLLKHKH